MTPEEVVRAELNAWGRLDLEAIMSYFATNAVWDNVPIGAAIGSEEIRSACEGWLAAITTFDSKVLNLASAGDVVLTERIDHVTLDGRLVQARVMGAFEVSGDRISAWRDYFDMGGRVAQNS